VIRLAGRLTAGGGRESLVRLLLTGLGLAAAVAMLLCAAVLLPALRAHDVARAWTQTTPDNIRPAQDESTTDPLLWRQTTDRFDGRDLLRVDVQALGPDAPVPPGLDELPGPGELAVSPALRSLLERTPGGQLADRFPGRVTATIGRAALASPDDLVVFVGRAPGELADRSEGDGVVTVRSIESEPLSRGLTQSMRIVVVVGAVGLLLPIVVFVTTATRLAAARRERRLAALRLAGATTGQVSWFAAVEAGLAAVAGVAIGYAVFFALRPALARIPFDGITSFPSDLRLSLRWALTIGLGVPALAVAAAVVSLRRIRISPLGTSRRSARSGASARPLLILAAGMVLLAAVSALATRSTAETAETYASGLALALIILGIVLSGPWLTSRIAGLIALFARRAPSLLAARRLQDNPASGFRAISGIVLAVFVGSIFAGTAASIMADDGRPEGSLHPGLVVASSFTEDKIGAPGSGTPGGAGSATLPARAALDPAATTGLVRDLEAIGGVDRVVTAHAFPDDPELLGSLLRRDLRIASPTVVSCDDVRLFGGEPCEGTTLVNMWGAVVEPTGIDLPVTATELDDLPVVGAAALTDGTTAAVESARTVLQGGLDRSEATTQRDIDAETQQELRTIQRVSNLGLAVTLVVAGCSLAVAVAGAIVERRQPLALLRLTGVRIGDLRRMVLAEAAAPLVVVAAASAGLGLAVAAMVLEAGGGSRPFVLPGSDYWLALLGGVGLALLVVLATLPLLDRLTNLDTARFE
jgi:hypothetical protein